MADGDLHITVTVAVSDNAFGTPTAGPSAGKPSAGTATGRPTA